MVVGNIEGCWRKQINWKAKEEKVRLYFFASVWRGCLADQASFRKQESRLLIDLDVLAIVPKQVRPLRFVCTFLLPPSSFPPPSPFLRSSS